MSLRHALLALLDATPMTGYTLAKHFDQSAAFVWHAPHSQIYPELRRMEAEGLITGRDERRGERGTKRTYFLTAGGRAELSRWVAEITPLAPERDAAYLKATYYEFGSFASARRQFQAHLAHYEQLQRQWDAHVDQLENRDTTLLRLRLAAWPEDLHEVVVAYKAHVYRGMAARARAQVQWAREGLALVDRLAAASGGPGFPDPQARPDPDEPAGAGDGIADAGERPAGPGSRRLARP
jgi:DNA-binding PadR family transcriptional regulator